MPLIIIARICGAGKQTSSSQQQHNQLETFCCRLILRTAGRRENQQRICKSWIGRNDLIEMKSLAEWRNETEFSVFTKKSFRCAQKLRWNFWHRWSLGRLVGSYSGMSQGCQKGWKLLQIWKVVSAWSQHDHRQITEWSPSRCSHSFTIYILMFTFASSHCTPNHQTYIKLSSNLSPSRQRPPTHPLQINPN